VSILGKLKASLVLDVAGLALIALALGLWLLPVGIGAAGVGCLLLSWRGVS
jgi:hypothetical protein